jgi:hypothetical protein
MPGSLHFALPSKRPLTPTSIQESLTIATSRRSHLGRVFLLAALLLACLCAAAGQVWAAAPAKVKRMLAPAATTTTLQTSPGTANQGPIYVLWAKVNDPNPVMQGLVSFYDGKTLLGAAQIVNAGTKYTHGTANLKVQLATGTHSLQAFFAGTTSDAPSYSSTFSFNFFSSERISTTSISSTGVQGNYTLTSQVVTIGAFPATGKVSFLDQNSSPANGVVGQAVLGAGSVIPGYASPVPYSIYDTADNSRPQQVVVADFNGDGFLDFAEVDYTGAISIHLGNGDGTFQAAIPFCTTGTPPTPCQAGSEPTTIAVGDFNSDGIPDLVVNDGSNVDVFLGNGDGTFQPGVPYATASGNYTIAVGDFNRDGTPDLAVTASDAVSILLGNGDGTFQPNSDISLSDSSWYVTVGDFNKDGIQDLAIAGSNGTNLMVLLGNGDGTFQTEKDTAYVDLNPGANIVAADFKGQGYLCDLALSGSGIAEAILGKGDGTFQTPAELQPNGSVWEYTGSVAVADFNGDGIPDLAMTWYENTDTAVGRVAVFYGKGNGTFSAPTTVNVGTGSGTGVQPVWVAVGDFDGNGSPDLVVANEVSSTDSVILDKSTVLASAVLPNIAISGASGKHNVYAQYAGTPGTAASSSLPYTVSLTEGGLVTPPTLSALSPSTAVAGGAAFLLTVAGANFASGAVINWGATPLATTYVSATKLTATVPSADIAAAGTYSVTVTIGSATTSALKFTVTAPIPVPVIDAISPDEMPAESAAFTLTVNGTGFVHLVALNANNSAIYWNATRLTTTYVSPTELTATIPATDVATAGSVTITVKNGAGPASNAMTFAITPEMYAPIAMGSFSTAANGTMVPGAHTPNLTCVWEGSSLQEYQCTITGIDFIYNNYVVNVSTAHAHSPSFAVVDSANGKLVVKIYNLSGTPVQEPLYICVYKP